MKKNFCFLVILSIIFFVTGCTGTVSSDDKGNTKTVFNINETAIVNNTKIKINSVKKILSECLLEYGEKCYSLNEPENDYFLLIDVTLENNSDEEISVSSLMQFELKSPDGEKANQEYMLDAVKCGLDGSIMPNDMLKGQIAFDVSDEEYYYFYYQDSLFDDNIKFVINKDEISE